MLFSSFRCFISEKHSIWTYDAHKMNLLYGDVEMLALIRLQFNDNS